jgi:hypothetical protein
MEQKVSERKIVTVYFKFEGPDLYGYKDEGLNHL